MKSTSQPSPSHAEPKASHATPGVYAYIGVLTFLILSPASFAFTPLQYMYADVLHLKADQTSIFKFIINSVGCIGFVFGMVRDRFSSQKWGDRGYFVLFGLMASAVFFTVQALPLTTFTLGAGLLLWGVTTNLIGAAYQALLRNVSDARMMSGRMSTTNQVVTNLISAGMLEVGGFMAEKVSWQVLFRIVGITYLMVAAFGLWKPRAVLQDMPAGPVKTWPQLKSEAGMLLRNRGYWVAIALWTIWAFSPAGGTPLQYYMSRELHMKQLAFSTFGAILTLSYLPGNAIFGALCKRVRLKHLLLVSTLIGIPQWLPVMVIHSPAQSYVVAVFVGLTGGLATTAYYGLLLRSTPRGLAGTGMMLAASMAVLITEIGNVMGGAIYVRWGFAGCAYITAAAYLLLLPLLFLLPAPLVDPRDDEHVPTEEELLAA